MVYPVQRSHSYTKRTKKKKKKSKLPFIVAIAIIIVIAILSVVFFLYNNLIHSKVVTDDRIDYVFYMKGIEKIFLIRTDKKEKINYLISIPKISYEPIMAISMDQPNPREISRSVEKLFGAVDSSFYSSIDQEAFNHIVNLSTNENTINYEQLTIGQFVEIIEHITLDWYEFLFFNQSKSLIQAQSEHNYTQHGSYRIIKHINQYANKEVPMTFMTKAPVKITIQQNGPEGNDKPVEYERLYIDDKSLDTIMEFMKR